MVLPLCSLWMCDQVSGEKSEASAHKDNDEGMNSLLYLSISFPLSLSLSLSLFPSLSVCLSQNAGNTVVMFTYLQITLVFGVAPAVSVFSVFFPSANPSICTLLSLSLSLSLYLYLSLSSVLSLPTNPAVH